MPAAYTHRRGFRHQFRPGVVVGCRDGRTIGRGSSIPVGRPGCSPGPHDPHLARQNPGDYLEGLRASVRGALADAARDAQFSPDA